MKKYYLFVIGIILTVVLINLILFKTIHEKEVVFQKNLLFSQLENSGIEIENSINTFENNINKILFLDDISSTFSDPALNESVIRKLEIYYSSHNRLIRNISIFDLNRNVLNLYQDQKENFIVNTYTAQRQLKLEEVDKVTMRDSIYHYHLPIFKENTVVANVVVSFDLIEYMQKILNRYHYEFMLWQSVVDDKGNILSKNIQASNIGKLPSDLVQNLKDSQKGFVVKNLTIDSVQSRFYIFYYPLTLLKQKLGIVFFMDSNVVFKNITRYIVGTALVSIFISIISILYFFRIVAKKHKSEETIKRKLKELSLTIDNLPIGVVILNGERKIKAINKNARELLFIRKDEEMTGINISDRFLMAKNYFSADDQSAFDTNQFILYQQEGNEVIVYKKETGFIVDGEDIFLEAFIDVTSIEKSRKYEAAANTAKSEFLAKMSHEIRTPMNGIIGMTDALDQDNLNSSQKEYIQIVRKSADLLLSIINDILDFSKIESGNMQLEEIPFNLSEEIKLSLDLFKPIIEEKNISVEVHVNKDVPDHIIGDPFRLRQVLSNLLSNSVKFTHEGKISISVNVDESYDGNYTLQFSVEDTGVGIPKHKLESIFNSFTQADESTSRKYGGSGLGTTIAKQLVNLMHGEIWVESPSSISKDPKFPGSKFTFTIEVYSNEPLKKKFDLSRIKNISELCVLIISKNEETKKRIVSILDLYDIKHKYYKYQEDKIDKLNDLLKANFQDFNILVILDEPNFNCLEFAKNAKDKEIMDNYLVFMVSSNHKQDNYILSKRAGVDYYMTQPIEQDEFIESIYRHLPNAEKVKIDDGKALRTDLSILVAEDNIINQKVAETIFTNLGYEIDLAPDGKIAVEMVQKKQYDIIFMDLLMPEKDGVQATVDIRGMGIQVPIVAMTATEGKKGKYRAITSGMNDYIVKPVKIEAIKKVLYKWFS